MCFLFWIIKAIGLEKRLKNYKRAKEMAYEQATGKSLGIELTKCEKAKIWWLRKCPIYLGGINMKKLRSMEMSNFEKFKLKLFATGTLENFIFKSVIGFLSGVCLTYMFFAFFILQLNFSFASATLICSFFGVVFTLGLAFSLRVRCIVMMMIPQLFSKRGRQALMAYAFILVLTGPAKNTLHNTRVLSESLVCAQERLKKSIRSVVDLINKPFVAIKNSLQQVMDKIEVIVKKMKSMMSAIKKTIMSLLGVIKSAFHWLNSIVGMCSKKMGTPYERCNKVFSNALDDCKIRLNVMFQWLCSVTYISSTLCYSVKFIDFICEGFEFISDELVYATKRKLMEFSHHIRNIFYVSIDFSHTFEYDTVPSKNVSEIAAGIAGEIRGRTAALLTLFDWMSFAFSFFFLYMVFQTLNYRRRYLANEWFDNRFLTNDFLHIDLKRTQMGKETVLPLSTHEKQKYLKMSSLRLASSEKKHLAKTAVFLCFATIKLSIHMLADYSLYWILSIIRYHGQFQTEFDAPPTVEVDVEGTGIISEIYLSIAKAFEPQYMKLDVDTTPCLPDPKPPDMNIYKQIISLLVLCWILSILEAYGLRMSNWVMCYYYPAAARKRAVWLYNHILQRRSTFLKFCRRQLRRKYGYGFKKDSLSLKERFKLTFPHLSKMLGLKKSEICLVCGAVGSSSQPLIHCKEQRCLGMYCKQCFSELENVCTLCLLPIAYGDFSDISEEKDSSDVEDETAGPFRRVKHEKYDLASDLSDSSSTAHAVDKAVEDLDYSYQNEKREWNDVPDLTYPGVDVEKRGTTDLANLNDVFDETETDREKSIKDELQYSRSLAQRKTMTIFPGMKGLRSLNKSLFGIDLEKQLPNEMKKKNDEKIVMKVQIVNEKAGYKSDGSEDELFPPTSAVTYVNEKKYKKKKKRPKKNLIEFSDSDDEQEHQSQLKKLKNKMHKQWQMVGSDNEIELERTTQLIKNLTQPALPAGALPCLDDSEDEVFTREKALSVLVPSVKNSSVSLTKVDVALQTETQKPFCYFDATKEFQSLNKESMNKPKIEGSKVAYLKEKLFGGKPYLIVPPIVPPEIAFKGTEAKPVIPPYIPRELPTIAEEVEDDRDDYNTEEEEESFVNKIINTVKDIFIKQGNQKKYTQSKQLHEKSESESNWFKKIFSGRHKDYEVLQSDSSSDESDYPRESTLSDSSTEIPISPTHTVGVRNRFSFAEDNRANLSYQGADNFSMASQNATNRILATQRNINVAPKDRSFTQMKSRLTSQQQAHKLFAVKHSH